MPQRRLPERPSLENLRKQVKDLAKAYRGGEPAALARVAAARQAAPKTPADRQLTLAGAQYIVAREYGLKKLSMGMSHDLEVAIEEGATHVRVGTALFGPRPKPK